MDISPAFLEALRGETTTLQGEHPLLADGIGRASAVIANNRLWVEDDGHSAMVQSGEDASTFYYVNGQCQCPAGQYRRDTPCKHRLGLRLFHRVLDRLFDDEERYALTEELRPAPSADKAPSSGIATRYIVMLQNKPFVKFSGLLDLAHQRGLQELRVDWTFNDAELSLAHAVAVFPFGTFEDSGEATKDNVNRKVSPHFRRCALTRASARALRLALGLDMVAVEALAEE